MAFNISKAVENEDVPFENPKPLFYEALGGEEGMQKMMYNFYDKLYESDIANFFPQDKEEFDKVKVKNSKFFIQVCGGPKVYAEAEEAAKGQDLDEYMIRIHDDFSITDKSRVHWLTTMKDAMDETDLSDEEKQSFWDYIEKFSKLTVNTYPKKENFF